MPNNRPVTPVDIVFIACLVTLMAVAVYTIPSPTKPLTVEVSTDGG